MRFTLLCAVFLFLCAIGVACQVPYGEPSLTAEAGVQGIDSQEIDEKESDIQEHSTQGAQGIHPSAAQNDTADANINADADSDTDLTTTNADTDSDTDLTTTNADTDSDTDLTTTNADADSDTDLATTLSNVTDAPPLPNDKRGWYYIRNKDHQPPTAQQDFDIRVFDGHYLGDITQKRVYLTFDEGYENGFTAPILDVLKEKNVTAAFFMTKTYIRDNPALAARIAAEGHVAANHSVRHISFPDLTDEEIYEELTETARYFEETTGYPMSPFVRPPSGEYSVRTLAVTQAAGYKSIFWSFAHEDWLVDQQPGKETTFTRVMDNLHNGAIILLHAVSESNTEALPDIIDAIREQGYTFGNLHELYDL